MLAGGEVGVRKEQPLEANKNRERGKEPRKGGPGRGAKVGM